MAHLPPYVSRGDGCHPEGVGSEGSPRSLSQKSPRAEKTPAETREYHQVTSCLHRQTAQKSRSQCRGTLTGLQGDTNQTRPTGFQHLDSSQQAVPENVSKIEIHKN